MKFEVNAALGVDTALGELVFRQPDGTFEVYLENHRMEPGCESPSLHAYFLFQADSLDDAETSGEERCRRFLDFLVFTTGARFRASSRLCVYDWSTGADWREGYVYRNFPNPDLPQLVLDHGISSSIELLLSANADADLRQAVHWFSAGVSATSPEEQFELFWFSIETIARSASNKTKVPDRCAMCQEPLYCPNCQKISTHRPYPSQTIRQLFARHVSNDADRMYRITSSMRHALLHGDRVSRVEAEFDLTLSHLVDIVGHIAWVALLTNLVSTVGEEGTVRMGFIQPSTFLHHRLEVKTHVGFKSPGGRPLAFADIPNINADLIVTDQPDDQVPAKLPNLAASKDHPSMGKSKPLDDEGST